MVGGKQARAAVSSMSQRSVSAGGRGRASPSWGCLFPWHAKLKRENEERGTGKQGERERGRRELAEPPALRGHPLEKNRPPNTASRRLRGIPHWLGASSATLAPKVGRGAAEDKKTARIPSSMGLVFLLSAAAAAAFEEQAGGSHRGAAAGGPALAAAPALGAGQPPILLWPG